MTKEERLKKNKELTESFSRLSFDEASHTYKLEDKPELIFETCSKISSRYNSFDEKAKKYWSEKKAVENNKSVEEILTDWKVKSDKALISGTALHKQIESYLIKKMSSEEVDDDKYDDRVVNFHNKFLATNGLEVVAVELRMFDEKLKICGTCDALIYDTNKNRYILMDWKTGKKITPEGKYIDKRGVERLTESMLKHPFNLYTDSNYYKYSIQLTAYKFILERNTDIKIDEMILVWFGENEFEPIKAKEMTELYTVLLQPS
jgi:formate-dependent nitrite reductase cytochrome c552 subunit